MFYTPEEWVRVRESILRARAQRSLWQCGYDWLVEHPRFSRVVLIVLILVAVGWYPVTWVFARLEMARAEHQERKKAGEAYAQGDPEPLLRLREQELRVFRSELASRKLQLESIRRNPKHVVTTNRRSGVEKRTEDLTYLLPEIHQEISSLQGRIATMESRLRR